MTTSESRVAFRLWRIRRIDGQYRNGANEALTQEFIISAKTEQAARELACDTVAEGDSCVWLDRRKSRITELGRSADSLRDTQIITKFPLPASPEGDDSN